MRSSTAGLALVFDCGATNLRVMAMDAGGNVVAAKAFPNSTTEDPFWKGGRIWDLEQLWQKFCAASKEVMAQIKGQPIVGLSVTTFGVDGTFVDEQGQALYPVISWQCPRLSAYMEGIHRYMPVSELYRISGVYPHAFNTIAKMAWFKEERPDVLAKAHRFLFLPSLFLHKLGGAPVNDTTMLGTSMMGDLRHRQPSEAIFKAMGLPVALFGEVAEPGARIGAVRPQAARACGIPEGTALYLGGHDTQFALWGSGAEPGQPVLSSGTWEILMVRSKSFSAGGQELASGLTTEADALPGFYNIGQNWLGSGVLEWFSRHFYPGMQGDALYQKMMEEAAAVAPGSKGLLVDPSFYNELSQGGGQIKGLRIQTSRGEIYRALLEGLSYRLREGLEQMQQAGGFHPDRIIVVGGGSKNELWNQIRAAVCGLPMQFIGQTETTVLGAAIFVFSGAGIFRQPEEARAQINYSARFVEPDKSLAALYEERYRAYLALKSTPH